MAQHKLTLTKESFYEDLSKLIASGVTFNAVEDNGMVIVTFTGGF